MQSYNIEMLKSCRAFFTPNEIFAWLESFLSFFSRLNILGVRDLDLMRQTALPWPDEHTTLSRNERAIYFAQLRPYNSRPEGDRTCVYYIHGTLIR